MSFSVSQRLDMIAQEIEDVCFGRRHPDNLRESDSVLLRELAVKEREREQRIADAKLTPEIAAYVTTVHDPRLRAYRQTLRGVITIVLAVEPNNLGTVSTLSMDTPDADGTIQPNFLYPHGMFRNIDEARLQAYTPGQTKWRDES